MSTVTAKNLALQYVSTTLSAVFTVPASTMYVVHSIVIHNTNTTSENVKIYHNDGTNDHLLYNITVEVNDTVHIELPGEGSVFEASHALKAETTTASKVYLEVNGSNIV